MSVQEFIESTERVLIKKRAELDFITKQLDDENKKRIAFKKEYRNTEEAKEIIRVIVRQTQEELEYQISDIVSLSLNAVFDDPYEFKVKFVLRRGKTEADLVLMKDGDEFDPMDSTGGGIVDVASFGLVVALWAMRTPRTRNTLVFDEPFKHLSTQGNLQKRASQVLSLLSKKLNIQFIMVTHNRELINNADKKFYVSQRKKISTVREVSNEEAYEIDSDIEEGAENRI